MVLRSTRHSGTMVVAKLSPLTLQQTVKCAPISHRIQILPAKPTTSTPEGHCICLTLPHLPLPRISIGTSRAVNRDFEVYCACS